MKNLIIVLMVLFYAASAYTENNEEIWKLVEKSGEKFKEAEAVMVLDRIETEYRENGSSTAVEEILLHFREEKGAANYRTLHYTYNPRTSLVKFLEVKIYHCKEKTVEVVEGSEIFIDKAPANSIFWNFNVVVCPLPYLEKDDALYFKIQRQGLNLAYLYEDGKEFIPPQEGYFMETLYFEDRIPLIDKTYTIHGPRARPLQFVMANGSINAEVRFTENEWIYKFSVKNVPAFEDEPFDNGYNEGALKLAMAAHPDWEMKSKWAYEHNEPQFIVSPEMKREVEHIVAGAKDDDDKMFRLLHWVAEEIRYLGLDMGVDEGHKVHPTDEIFFHRAGVCKDKAAVLVSMLRAAGFETYFVLTLAMEQTLDIPADDRFNHGVVAVRKRDGTWVFLDPTWAPQNRPLFNHLEQEQPLLIASPEGTNLTHVPYSPPEDNPFVISADTRVELNGDAESVIRMETDGEPDGDFRRIVSRRNAHERDKFFWRLFEDAVPGGVVKDVDYSFSNPANFYKPMKIEFRGKFRGLAEKVENTLYLTPLLTRHLYGKRYQSDYLHVLKELDLEKRKHDLELSCTRLAKFHENLTIPEGYTIKTLPDSVNVKSPTVDMRFQIKRGRQKNVYTIDETIKIKKRVTPVGELGDVKKALEKLMELQKIKLVIEPAGKSRSNPEELKTHELMKSSADSIPEYGAKIKYKSLEITLNKEGKITEKFHSEAEVFNDDGRDRFADAFYVINSELQQYDVVKCATVTQAGRSIDSPETAVNLTLDDRAVEAPDYRSIHGLAISHVGVEFGSTLVSTMERTTDVKGNLEYYCLPQEDYPVGRFEFIMNVPEGREIQYEALGIDSNPEVSVAGGVKTYKWTLLNLQAAIDEDNAGSGLSREPVIVVSGEAVSDWSTHLEPLRKDFFSFGGASPEIQKKLDQILEKSLSAYDKISAIRDFVSGKINPVQIEPHRFLYRTRPSERILESGYGISLDRLKLFACMIEMIGGHFELCLAGDKDRVSLKAPCIRALPMLFAHITLSDEDIFADLESGFLNIHTLSDKRAIAVNRDAVHCLQIPETSPQKDRCSMSLSLKIDDQRKATGELELFYAGSFNPFDQARRNTQDWLKGNIPEIIDKPEIKSFHVLKLWPGETGTHFQCSFEGNVKQDTVAASLYSLQLPLCPGGIIKECDFPATSHRNLPVMLKSSGDEKVRIEIEYPEAWAAVFIPSNEQATNEFWNYSKTATHEKNKITFSRNLAFLKNSIPAEDYNELADLWHSCSGENDNRVVFRTDQAHK